MGAGVAVRISLYFTGYYVVELWPLPHSVKVNGDWLANVGDRVGFAWLVDIAGASITASNCSAPSYKSITTRPSRDGRT